MNSSGLGKKLYLLRDELRIKKKKIWFLRVENNFKIIVKKKTCFTSEMFQFLNCLSAFRFAHDHLDWLYLSKPPDEFGITNLGIAL
jgi:hypothetical protein